MEEEGKEIKTCICFVPLGVAAEVPTLYDVNEEEVGKDKNRAVASSEMTTEPSPTAAMNDLPADLRMDEYDHEGPSDMGAQLSVVSEADLNLVAQGDPLIDKTELAKAEDDEDDLKIDPKGDYPIILGSVEASEDAAVETVIYSREDSANYGHHSIMTAGIPLALAWLPVYKTHRKKHFIAVASFLPVIEIFNNDVIEQFEPDGRLDSQQIHHTEAVCALSVNPLEQHLLLSASHDKSAIIWDTKTLKPVKQFGDLLAAKINAADWCPDGRHFIVAGEAKEIFLVNARSEAKYRCNIDEEVESLTWLDEHTFAVVTQGGSLMCYAFDNSSSPNLIAETTVCDGPCLAVCKTLESNLIVVGCENGTAYVYEFVNNSLNKICEKPMLQGSLYDVKPSPDIPHLVAFAANDVVVWDLIYEEAVQRARGLTIPT